MKSHSPRRAGPGPGHTRRRRGAWGVALAGLALLAACGAAPEAADAGAAPADAVSYDVWFGHDIAGKDTAGKDGAGGDASPVADATPQKDGDATASGETAVGSDSSVSGDTDASQPGDAPLPGCEDLPCDEGGCGPECDPLFKCGDGECGASESTATCPGDCPPPPPKCADGWCQDPENPGSCPLDCDAGAAATYACVKSACPSQTSTCAAEPVCLDAMIQAVACVAACGGLPDCLEWCSDSVAGQPKMAAVAKCGFSTCSGAPPGGICGDGTCDADEKGVCAADCGGGGSQCGDGTCSSPETQATCPADCKAATVKCGDGKCQAPETSTSCPADCKAPAAKCGDLTCQATETIAKCPIDCDPDGVKGIECMKNACPAETEACLADDACVAALTESGNCIKACGTTDACVKQCQGPIVGNQKALAFALCGLEPCQ